VLKVPLNPNSISQSIFVFIIAFLKGGGAKCIPNKKINKNKQVFYNSVYQKLASEIFFPVFSVQHFVSVSSCFVSVDLEIVKPPLYCSALFCLSLELNILLVLVCLLY